MSNLAVKLPERQNQPQRQQPNHQNQPKQKQQPRKKRLFTGFESFIIVLFFASLAIFGFMYLSSSYQLYNEHHALEEIKTKVDTQKIENKDLQTEVERLSTYERIMTKAKELGLSIDSKNIKSINQ